MTARQIGFACGVIGFAITLLLPAPAGMPAEAWPVAGLVILMAAWWMTEAVPLSVTALLPFVILPLVGVMDARATASAYYSPIIFLLLGGAFLALAIERTGLHKRLSLAILKTLGAHGGQTQLLLAFMIAAAILSMLISNTSTALIMMPMALAVLAGGGVVAGEDGEVTREGLSGALPMGIAFAASIGGIGTLVGSPTNAIAVGLIDETTGTNISFGQWMAYGLPIVFIGIPIAAWLITRVQKVKDHPFDVEAARASIDTHAAWTKPEARLIPIVALTFLAWMTVPWVKEFLPAGSWTNGTIAIIASLALFILPDGTGRKMLNWQEADRAPWGVFLMFGGGLALAAGMGASGLADWIGLQLLPLETLPLIVIAAITVALVIIITEFASNVATASGIIPVVAALVVAMGVDPILLAMPAAIAASWGFMLPAGTGPNAIAWSTGRIKLSRMVGAGIVLDIVGIALIVGAVFGMHALIG